MKIVTTANEIVEITISPTDTGLYELNKFVVNVFENDVIVTAKKSNHKHIFVRTNEDLIIFVWGTAFVTLNREDIEKYLKMNCIVIYSMMILFIVLFGVLVYAHNLGYF